MQSYFKNSLDLCAKYVCEIALLLCLFLSYRQQVQDKQWENIIEADGLGYYSYLPAVFIYNDLSFSFTTDIAAKYPNIRFWEGFSKPDSRGQVNKYFVGLSLLWLPFFLLAHLLSLLLGFPADGYSQLYQIFILLAANFYLWIGCRFTRKLLLEYSVPPGPAAFILLSTVFATNLFFYVTADASMTHVYSFALIAAFLYNIHSFFKSIKVNHLYWGALLLGLIVLLRPTNIVIVLMVPFFAGNLKSFFEMIRMHKLPILIAGGIFLLGVLPQFIWYYMQTGHFVVWSYGEEGFNFNDPQIFNVLFSYQKGMFIYTPLILLSLGGLLYLFAKNKFQFAVMLIFLLVSTYIISSWWCWWYGDSLGQRAFIDYYAVLALLLSFLYLSTERRIYKWAYFAVAVIFSVYSFILTYQYRHSIIHRSWMNEQRFWFSFLKTDPKYDGIVYADALFDLETTNIVTIKAGNNKFLCSERNGSSDVLANRESASSWETFNMVVLENSRIALLADDGHYLSARLNEGGIIRHNAKEIDDWEKFEMVQAEGGRVYLRASNNKFVVLEEEKLAAKADSVNVATGFVISEL